jgi:hypothetical protein
MELYEVEEKIRAVLKREEKRQCRGQTFYRSKLNDCFKYANSDAEPNNQGHADRCFHSPCSYIFLFADRLYKKYSIVIIHQNTS